MTDERKTMTVPEAGAYLGISRGAAYKAAQAGQIPCLKIGGRWLVPVEPLRRMVEDCQRAAA